MANLRETLWELGSEHRRIRGNGGYSDLYSIDWKSRSIKNGDKFLVKNGEIVPQTLTYSDGRELTLDSDWGFDDEDFYKGIERRFPKYYYSVPGKSEAFVKPKFLPKSVNELTYRQMMDGYPRNVARYELETFILYCLVKGTAYWQNEKHVYWQSKEYPKLIIYRTDLGL